MIRPHLQVSIATAQAIADRLRAGTTVANVFSIHGGEMAAVYEIAFTDGHPSLILKIYPEALHWKMRKETRIIALAQGRLSVAVPEILLADDTKHLVDLNFLVMTKLDGVLLGSIERTLTPDQFASAYRQIGSLLHEFHRIRMQAFGYIGEKGIVAPYASNHAYLTAQFERKLKEFLQRGGTEALARRIEKYAALHASLLHACTQAVVCHNDLHAGNLFARVNRGAIQLCGVVDFEGALAGDPLMDIAKALYYLSGDARRALLEGYGSIGSLHEAQALNFYHLYFVLELWCWMVQIGNKQSLAALTRDLERYSTP